ncbi:MAG: hypothetical protein IKZ82_09455 [Clostridia bacterium]|nr:hypothetical protein [Clostridia bacterium]
MRKTFFTAIAAVLVLSMVFGVLPVFAESDCHDSVFAAPFWDAPNGYNEHDYNKCVSFLEIADENGVRNGTKVTSGYDPSDPTTWGSNWANDFFEWVEIGGEKRIYKIDIADRDLIGSLDLSDCSALNEIWMSSNNITGLNISGCTALIKVNANWNAITDADTSDCTTLKHLYISYNALSELDISTCSQLEYLTCYANELSVLDVSHCPLLTDLYCQLNRLTELDISQNPALETLDCSLNELTALDVSNNTALSEFTVSGNALTELDVSNCAELRNFDCGSNELSELDVSCNTALIKLYCSGNKLTELDLSNNPELAYDSVIAVGNGYIGYDFLRRYYGDSGSLYAQPLGGAEFEGFFNESGELIGEGQWSNSYGAYVYSFEGLPVGTVFARFTNAVPGDVDGNGSVTVADAATALRIAMELFDGSGFNLDNADMDSNGSITVSDAVVIMRMAMGLIGS